VNVPGKAGELGQCLLVVEALDISYFSDDSSGQDISYTGIVVKVCGIA